MRPTLPSFLLAVGALLVVACGGDNPTQPKQTPHVALTVAYLGDPVFAVDSAGFPTISCQVELHLASTGTAPAHWTGGVLRAYLGRDRATPVDTSILAAADVAQIFEGADLPVGGTRDERFIFAADIPFAVALDLAYTGASGGATQHTSAQFACGATPPPNTAPPTVTVSYVDPGTALEPGGDVEIVLTAASDYGLWRTTVGITGPCTVSQSINESMLRSVTRHVHLTLPADCQLGVPIQVTATAVDGAAQQTTVSQSTPLMLVDRTPPSITVSYHPPYGGSDVLLQFAHGDRFVGDTISFQATASDNHAVRWIVWEIPEAGIRDSAAGSSATVRIPVRSAWGAFRLRAFARDAVGLESPIVASPLGAFAAYPEVTLPTALLDVPGVVDDAIVDAAHDRILLLRRSASEVVVVTASTMTVERRIALPFAAPAFALSPDGGTLFVAYHDVAAFDLANPGATPVVTPLTTLSSASGEGVFTMSGLTNGHLLLGRQGLSPGSDAIVDFDVATGAQRVRTDATANFLGPSALDGSAAFIHPRGDGCVQRYAAAADAFGGCVMLPTFPPPALAADLQGTHYLANLSLFDASLQLVAKGHPPDFTDGRAVLASALAPDAATMYFVPWPGPVYRARGSDGGFIDRIRLPFASARLIRVSADGSMLVTIGGDPQLGPTVVGRTMLR